MKFKDYLTEMPMISNSSGYKGSFDERRKNNIQKKYKDVKPDNIIQIDKYELRQYHLEDNYDEYVLYKKDEPMGCFNIFHTTINNYKGVQVKWVIKDNSVKSKIIQDVYLLFVEKYGTLFSDVNQTHGSASLWKRLFKIVKGQHEFGFLGSHGCKDITYKNGDFDQWYDEHYEEVYEDNGHLYVNYIKK